jgi:hypothetical protein
MGQSRTSLRAVLAAGVLLVTGSCAPERRQEELGQIETTLPDPEEIGGRYELPDLSPTEGEEGDRAAALPRSQAAGEAENGPPARD